MRIRDMVKNAAYRIGIDIRRAQPLPTSGDVPSVADAWREQMRMLKRRNRPIIFDVGAHVGRTALRYKQMCPDAIVYCFEPIAESFRELKRNVGVQKDIFAFQWALGRSTREACINVNRSLATCSLLPTDSRASETWNGTDVTETVAQAPVTVRSLDEFLVEHPEIDRIDILKMDVQGAEMEVLEGARETLRAGRVDLIFTEIILLPTYVGQSELCDYLRVLSEQGFGMHNMFNYCYTNDGQLNQLDILFRRGVNVGR